MKYTTVLVWLQSSLSVVTVCLLKYKAIGYIKFRFEAVLEFFACIGPINPAYFYTVNKYRHTYYSQIITGAFLMTITMQKEPNEAVNRESNVNWGDGASDLNQYETLSDKWNDIQEAYFEKYPEIEDEELFYESGGFERLLEKISEIRKKSIDEIREEIENW